MTRRAGCLPTPRRPKQLLFFTTKPTWRGHRSRPFHQLRLLSPNSTVAASPRTGAAITASFYDTAAASTVRGGAHIRMPPRSQPVCSWPVLALPAAGSRRGRGTVRIGTNGRTNRCSGADCAIALSSQSRGRNGMKSGMASSSIFSSIVTALPLSPEISINLSKFAGLYPSLSARMEIA